ncbi:beta-carotene 15,15'-dioxygenase-domain-containing protein [Catenaria anguillulae PL171]|uniref:Beta-carotene 15,15'-dioxygenase-domain-containing protein n=1 Tax=Catenaria anguillulae PL171 TaxID=765915 RepID=A0A1Y2H486_9FUNG|nr:beta-carotene 15,15'-dioxygenase-domain-containing protein [Catenaria anguillulae PL171]
MTLTPPSPTRPPLTLPAVASTALAVLSSHVFPAETNMLAFPLTLALIAIFGVPHGAADHLVHAWRHLPTGRKGGDAKFFAGYIALVVAHATLWYLCPPAAFALFLCMAVWHFGQGEYEYLGGRSPLVYYGCAATCTLDAWVVYVSRGIMILSLLTFAQPSLTFPVIQAVTTLDTKWIPDPSAPSTLAACRIAVTAGVAQHVLLLSYLLGHSTRPTAFLRDHVPKLVALALLYTHVNAYLAFGIYFGLWHALEFFLSVKSSLALTTRGMIAWAVVPLSLPVLGAMLVMGMYWDQVGMASEVAYWRAFLVVVSSVTTPHVVYLEGFVRVRMAGGSKEPNKQMRPQRERNEVEIIKSAVVNSCENSRKAPVVSQLAKSPTVACVGKSR